MHTFVTHVLGGSGVSPGYTIIDHMHTFVTRVLGGSGVSPDCRTIDHMHTFVTRVFGGSGCPPTIEQLTTCIHLSPMMLVLKVIADRGGDDHV